MRGLGAFQRAQIKRGDPRITEVLDHIRSAIDLIEGMAHDAAAIAPSEKPQREVQGNQPVPPPLTLNLNEKISRTLAETSKLTGLSRSSLYKAISEGRLRAVKCGGRTLILTVDLQAWMDSWKVR